MCAAITVTVVLSGVAAYPEQLLVFYFFIYTCDVCSHNNYDRSVARSSSIPRAASGFFFLFFFYLDLRCVQP